jgi:unspecific monooxygenase
LSMLFIVVLGFAFLSYLSYKCFIYPAFLSPLAAIPNAHFTSSFSNGWMIWQRYRGQPNKAIHDAHTRLGPVVRLGLTEISVNSIEGLNVVYGGNFAKDKFYTRFANFEYVQVYYSS